MIHERTTLLIYVLLERIVPSVIFFVLPQLREQSFSFRQFAK